MIKLLNYLIYKFLTLIKEVFFSDPKKQPKNKAPKIQGTQNRQREEKARQKPPPSKK